MAEGLLTYGTSEYGTHDVRIRLADTANPYRPIVRSIWPGGTVISDDDRPQGSDPLIARWSMSRWDRGELQGLWEPGGYRESTNVKPDRRGDRLELGAFREVAQHDGGSDFSEGVKFGRGQGLLFTADDTPLSWWQLATGDFDETGWATGATSQTVVSLADADDASNMLLSLDDKSVRKVASGGNSELIASGTPTYAQELRTAEGVVYALDGGDLYSVNTSSGARTVKSNPSGSVATYMASAGNIWRRLCVTDTGLAWLLPEDNGTVRIMEYNSVTDTDHRSGKLPVEFAFPYSMHFAHGFLFVGYRFCAAHDQKGDAYIYFQRGGQWGSAGPIRLVDSSSASQPVIIAGVIGDDLIFYYGGAVWAYDLSAGAIFQLAKSGAADATTVTDAATYGKEVFLANTDGSAAVEHFDTTLYTTDDASWSSGRFDFDLPGISKTMLRVTVVVDPLDANTTMTLKMSADGATAVSVDGTFNTDDDTTYTWTTSVSGGTQDQVTGRDFEIELIPDSTNSANTPKIREVFAEAISAEKRRGVELDVDLTHGQTVKAADGTKLLADLRSAAEYSGGVVKFTDPWGVASHEAKRSSDVMVELVGGLSDRGVATVRLWEVSNV